MKSPERPDVIVLSHSGAHARTRRAPGALALTAAAALAVSGAGAAAYASRTAAPAPGPAVAVADVARSDAAVAGRAADQRASRSTTRADLAVATDLRAALRAPASLSSGAAYGALGVKAVAKPKPAPEPVAAQAPAPATGSATTARTQSSTSSSSSGSSSSSSGSSSSGGSSSTYAGAGAAMGLTPAAAAVYSAIRSTFGITNIGGVRPGDPGDHGTGRAVDVMISSSGQGDAVASYAIANMGSLGISYVIWQQRIWLAGSGGWRAMEDRGSPTANHMDHVHISVN